MYQVVIVDDEVTISEGIANLFPWKEIGFEESQDHRGNPECCGRSRSESRSGREAGT